MLTEAEKELFKAELKHIVDVDAPAIIGVEEDKLPVAYQGMVKLIGGALLPQLQAALDARIDAFFQAGA